MNWEPLIATTDWDAVWQTLLLREYNPRLVVISTALLGVAAGLAGTFLLLRKQSLMGDALSHSTLPGIALAFMVAVMLGAPAKSLPVLLMGATVFGVIGVVSVLAIHKLTRIKPDAAMGIVLSVFFGIGTVLLRMVQDLPQASAAGLESFIYGRTATVIFQDLILISVVAALVAVACVLLFKEFKLVCFDEAFAGSQGWPVLWIDLSLLALVIAVTVIGLQAVGLILIIALLIIPAAAARFWTHDLKRMAVVSAVIGGLSGAIGGMASSLLPDLPAGAVIVLIAAAMFLISMMLGPTHGVLHRWFEQYRLRRAVGRQHLLRALYEYLENRAAPDGGGQPAPGPVPLKFLRGARSWSSSSLNRLIRAARRDGLVRDPADGACTLTEAGRAEAARVVRNHRLWETYLVTHADIAPSHVDRDADMIEHVLGPEMIRKLEDLLAGSDPARAMPPSPHVIGGDAGR